MVQYNFVGNQQNYKPGRQSSLVLYWTITVGLLFLRINIVPPRLKPEEWPEGYKGSWPAQARYYRRNKIKHQDTTRKYYQRNKKQHYKWTREWQKKNPAKISGYQLKRNYGLTLDDYANLVEKQNGCCAICETPFVESKPYVDHDHSTGIVRSLLCSRCNIFVGFIERSPDILTKILHYCSL